MQKTGADCSSGARRRGDEEESRKGLEEINVLY